MIPEQSQGDNYVRNVQWILKEVIHNNNNGFMATKLPSVITIRSVRDGSYHPN